MSPIDDAFRHFPTLDTPNLHLRALTLDDADDLFHILGDPQVTRHYELETVADVDEAAELIDFFAESFEVERMIRWGIVPKVGEDAGRVIGTCGYVWLREHRAETGYDLARSHWRRGIMTEALGAVLDFGFGVLALNRIEALVMRDNAASAGLLHALGFTEEGLLREHDFFKEAFHDMRCFGLLRREWGRG